MNEEVSLISMHPFFRRFVFAVAQTVRERGGIGSGRVVIDADMVPRGSEAVARVAVLREVPALSSGSRTQEAGSRRINVGDMSELVAPIEVKTPEVRSQKLEVRSIEVPVPKVELPRSLPVVNVPVTKPVVELPKPRVETPSPLPVVREEPVVLPKPRPVPVIVPPLDSKHQMGQAERISLPVIEEEEVSVGTDEGYVAIEPLLGDPSVSTIECLGAGKELMVVRAGQKQKTRIVLGKGGIREVLERVADEAHIPLMDGIFRATLNDFSINAVVSEMVGSRFVIKKATAYSMLE